MVYNKKLTGGEELKQLKILKLLTIILPIIVVLGISAILIQNHIYNTTLRTYEFSEEALHDGIFDFGEVSVEVVTRGGDSGSWMKDATYDNDGNKLTSAYVGTIYEMVVTNKSADIVSDWQMKVYIPEDMLINNSWNGLLEYHQHVATGEKVQSIDLAEYSSYDITLDYFMDAVGPMVELDKGDYFIYYPDKDINEMPISPVNPDSDKPAAVRIGFVTYIADKPVDYVADFSKGEINFHLQTSVVRNPLFWVLLALGVVWFACLLALVIVNANLKRLVEQKKRDEQIIEQTMNTFINIIEAKDPGTMGHSLRVAQYSKLIAQRMGFDEDECKQIYYIGLMHDCGKLYIPDSILTKPGKLTDEEYNEMKKHTTYGSNILRDFTSIDNIQLGAMYHHERYDGKGYPTGKSGEDIPLIARIICVSDAFDAMNSQRCYRSSLSPEIILSELENNKGSQFDPAIVEHLQALIDDGKVKLSGNN